MKKPKNNPVAATPSEPDNTNDVVDLAVPEADASVARNRTPTNIQNEETSFHLMSQIDYSSLTNDQLHREMLAARTGVLLRCLELHSYAMDKLIPACEEIIKRYKMQGVAAKDRPNGQPTVEAYFRSINLNYNTVRSWFYRQRIKTEPFLPPQVSRRDAAAAAAYKLVDAVKAGDKVNVEEAISEVEKLTPLPPLDPFSEEDKPERPLDVILPQLAMRLVRELESYFIDPSVQISVPEKPSMPKAMRGIVDRLHAELPRLALTHEQTVESPAWGPAI